MFLRASAQRSPLPFKESHEVVRAQADEPSEPVVRQVSALDPAVQRALRDAEDLARLGHVYEVGGKSVDDGWHSGVR